MKDLFLTFENYTWAKGKDEGPRRLNKLGALGVILALFYLFFHFIYVFIFGCTGSLSLRLDLL